MKVEATAAQAAFEQHLSRYGKRERAWDIPYHVRMWELGRRAFHDGSFLSFQELYEELRRRWQVFRSPDALHWSAQQIYDQLRALDRSYQDRRLSELALDDAPGLWNVLQAIQGIKTNSDGPAVVALSKFLHFWNPRLFLIVDYGVVWSWVFRHSWLWKPVEQMRQLLSQRIPAIGECPVGTNCDLGSYLAILMWTGRLMADNPLIVVEFARYIHKQAPGLKGMEDVGGYEAVAAEWFLLGVVELPPQGVSIASEPER